MEIKYQFIYLLRIQKLQKYILLYIIQLLQLDDYENLHRNCSTTLYAGSEPSTIILGTEYCYRTHNIAACAQCFYKIKSVEDYEIING